MLGLSHEALNTIYKGAILPLLLYGAPVWIEALVKECNRVQLLINIKISKAFRTTSNEALCALTVLIPVVIKAEEAAKLYIMRKSRDHVTDYEVPSKDWLHPADSVRITEQKDEHAIQVFTDGSKNEHGVGAGIAIFIQSKLEHQLMFTLLNRCSNNQAEQLAIVKALETIHINDIIPRTVTVHTDSRITLQSQEPKKSQLLYSRNQEESNST